MLLRTLTRHLHSQTRALPLQVMSLTNDACSALLSTSGAWEHSTEATAVMAERNALEKLDVGALSPEQQEKLRHFKIKTRIANEKYLRSHPEVEMLLSDFLRNVFLKKPLDIREFAADHFSDPGLSEKIQTQMIMHNK